MHSRTLLQYVHSIVTGVEAPLACRLLFVVVTTALSHWDFSHMEIRVAFPGKSAATETRYPTYSACWVISVSMIHWAPKWNTESLTYLRDFLACENTRDLGLDSFIRETFNPRVWQHSRAASYIPSECIEKKRKKKRRPLASVDRDTAFYRDQSSTKIVSNLGHW